jgi:hypothetical protein
MAAGTREVKARVGHLSEAADQSAEAGRGETASDDQVEGQYEGAFSSRFHRVFIAFSTRFLSQAMAWVLQLEGEA